MREKILEKFKNENPKRTIKDVYNYNIEFFLIYAPLNNEKNDKNNSYFLVQKNTGKWRSFSPLENFNLFDNALNNKLN